MAEVENSSILSQLRTTPCRLLLLVPCGAVTTYLSAFVCGRGAVGRTISKDSERRPQMVWFRCVTELVRTVQDQLRIADLALAMYGFQVSAVQGLIDEPFMCAQWRNFAHSGSMKRRWDGSVFAGFEI